MTEHSIFECDCKKCRTKEFRKILGLFVYVVVFVASLMYIGSRG